MIPKVPKRWAVRGELPVANPEMPEADLELLDEDLVQITDPSGTYVVDVGWYPAGQRNGRFVCRIMRANDWERPVEQVELASLGDTRQWIKRSIEQVQWRLGRQGDFSKQVGVWIYRFLPGGRVKKTGKPTKRAAPTLPDLRSPNVSPEAAGEGKLPRVPSSFTTPLRVQPQVQHAA
jgi:hypothetical protein